MGNSVGIVVLQVLVVGNVVGIVVLQVVVCIIVGKSVEIVVLQVVVVGSNEERSVVLLVVVVNGCSVGIMSGGEGVDIKILDVEIKDWIEVGIDVLQVVMLGKLDDIVGIVVLHVVVDSIEENWVVLQVVVIASSAIKVEFDIDGKVSTGIIDIVLDKAVPVSFSFI